MKKGAPFPGASLFTFMRLLSDTFPTKVSSVNYLVAVLVAELVAEAFLGQSRYLDRAIHPARWNHSAAVDPDCSLAFLSQLSHMPFISKLDPITVKCASEETLSISFGMIGSDQSLMLPHCIQIKCACSSVFGSNLV
jgi:hypothetical protein